MLRPTIHILTLILIYTVVIANTADIKTEGKLDAATTSKPPDNLYPDGGAVINLEDKTFYPHLKDSDRSWLVLFYLSWCGHCINYVPTYTTTAESLQVWSKYLGVSAINCAKDLDRAICRDHNITNYPTVVYIPSHTKNTTASQISLPYKTFNEAKDLIAYAEGTVKSQHPDAKPRSDIILSHKPQPTKEHLPISDKKNKVVVTKNNASILYYEDLIYGLQYSLVREVGGHIKISGPALQALKDYINILSLYFPDTEQPIAKSLKLLNDSMEVLTGSITHHDWTRLLADSGVTAAVNGREDLIRCRGSQSKYRGYPCTLWSLFHTLTVQATIPIIPELKLKKTEEHTSYDVLKAMRGYIANFFTCQECKEHFATMAVEIEAMADISNQPAVIWLWSAHNRVNKRLAGDKSEDPNFPKTEFPSAEACPSCKTPKGIWDEDVVYDYLHSIYTDIRHRAAPIMVERRGLQPIGEGSHHIQQPQYSSSWNSLGLSRIEMSMCYMLYLVSALVIGVLFYFIVIKQRIYLRYRKCPPKVHDRYTYDKPIY